MVYLFGEAMARSRTLAVLHLTGNMDHDGRDKLILRAMCQRARVKKEESQAIIDFNHYIGEDGTTFKIKQE